MTRNIKQLIILLIDLGGSMLRMGIKLQIFEVDERRVGRYSYASSNSGR